MKITIDQDEIEEAVEAFIRRQIAINDDQTITIEFTAGRGANGLSAALDISSRPRPASVSTGMPNPVTKAQKPFVSKTTAEEEEPEQEETTVRKTHRKPFFNAEATVEESEETEADEAPEAEAEETSGVVLENQAQEEAEEQTEEEVDEAPEEPAPKKLRSTKSIFSKAS